MKIKDIAFAALSGSLMLVALGCQQKGPALGDADKHFIAAQQALSQGDKAKAMEELNTSIEIEPQGWSYYERAKLHLDQGDESAAMADCKAGLQLEPENSELKWLMGELEKPAGQRFKGKNAEPPAVTK